MTVLLDIEENSPEYLTVAWIIHSFFLYKQNKNKTNKKPNKQQQKNLIQLLMC